MKKYTIESIDDISKATTLENFEDFIIDLRGILCVYHQLKSIDNNVRLTKFVWIDDKKHNIDVILSDKK